MVTQCFHCFNKAKIKKQIVLTNENGGYINNTFIYLCKKCKNKSFINEEEVKAEPKKEKYPKLPTAPEILSRKRGK